MHVFEQAHQKGPFDLRESGKHLLLKMAHGLWDDLLERLPFHGQFHNDQSKRQRDEDVSPRIPGGPSVERFG
jgi:hypothetical protein